jgi:uncharacterized protein YndB with AHSA1/START domain
MNRQHHGRVIHTSIRMKTTPMKAWEAWADPQKIANWFVDRAEGTATPGSTMKWFFDSFGYAMDVPIAEADPGRSFVVSSGDHPGPDGLPYLMEITIEKDGGETVMNLVNSGFSEAPEKDEKARGVDSGWQMALATMKLWLERYPMRARRHEIVVRPASYEAGRLHELFATARGRSLWLEPDIASAGEVLCDTGTEVLLSWDSRDAAIGLKAFAMGPQQMVALDYSCWPAEGEVDDADASKARLTRALDRLVDAITARPSSAR